MLIQQHGKCNEYTQVLLLSTFNWYNRNIEAENIFHARFKLCQIQISKETTHPFSEVNFEDLRQNKYSTHVHINYTSSVHKFLKHECYWYTYWRICFVWQKKFARDFTVTLKTKKRKASTWCYTIYCSRLMENCFSA